jgi:hypothetical protein
MSHPNQEPGESQPPKSAVLDFAGVHTIGRDYIAEIHASGCCDVEDGIRRRAGISRPPLATNLHA